MKTNGHCIAKVKHINDGIWYKFDDENADQIIDNRDIQRQNFSESVLEVIDCMFECP